MKVYSLTTDAMPTYNVPFTMTMAMSLDCYVDDATICESSELSGTQSYVYFTLEVI